MKLSKRIWIIIALGIFVITFASLSYILFQLFDERDQLKQQLELSQTRLQSIQPDVLHSQQEELEVRLNNATEQYEDVRTALSQPVNNTSVAASIFEIAESYGLIVSEVTSPGRSHENLEGIDLLGVPLTAKVDGDVTALVNFITELNTFFTTGVVQSVTITVPEGSGTDNASANVQLTVYTYVGD